jgi:hypothetical protein
LKFCSSCAVCPRYCPPPVCPDKQADRPKKISASGNTIKTCRALGLLSKQLACCARNLSQMTPGGVTRDPFTTGWSRSIPQGVVPLQFFEPFQRILISRPLGGTDNFFLCRFCHLNICETILPPRGPRGPQEVILAAHGFRD